jgi:hypothetical protein
VKRLAILVALAGCPRVATKAQQPIADVGDNAADSEQDRRLRLIAELQDDILSSYEREEVPDDTTMILPTVGQARVGVGPGDIYYGEGFKRAPSRWPIRVDASTPTVVRSKHLDIHLSQDKQVSAAWMADEVSWRVTFCGRTAVIPLRMTALYAHDGDRWIEVFEHLSYARLPTPSSDGKLIGTEIVSARPEKLYAELVESLRPLLRHDIARMKGVLSIDPEHLAESDPKQAAPTLLLSPDPEGEWHGDAVGCTSHGTQQSAEGKPQPHDCDINVQLVDGSLINDDARIGTVGRYPDSATIAYWVGNFVATLNARPGIPGGRVRLRGTFIFEKRKQLDVAGQPTGRNVWVVVQGHVSQPIQDDELAQNVFGTALESTQLFKGEPLRVTCEDGRRSTVTRGQATPAVEP